MTRLLFSITYLFFWTVANCQTVTIPGGTSSIINAPISGIEIADTTSTKWIHFGNFRILRVAGKIYAQEIQVKTDVWADHVFGNSYVLTPLQELEDFIRVNKHLPDVPTEDEVIKCGINIGEMNVLLLKKI